MSRRAGCAAAALALVGVLAAGGAVAATPRHRAVARHARPGLVLPYVSRHACPFECCVYRRWSAVSRLRVYAAERDSGHVAFRIAAGDSFEALTGDVYVVHPGTARVLLAHSLRIGRARVALAAGDSVTVLDPMGEGTYRAYFKGHLTEVFEHDFVPPDPQQAEPTGEWLRMERAPDIEWWVRIRTLDGQEGWLRMDEDQQVDNADSCA